MISFGAHAALPKYISEFSAKNKKKIGHLVLWFVKTRLISFLILGILIFLFRYQISMYFFHNTTLAYLIIPGLIYFFSMFFAILPFIVQGYQNFKLFALSSFFAYALPPLAAIILLPFNIFYMILGFGLATAISYLITLKFIVKKGAFKAPIRFDLKKIIWSFSIPMYILGIVFSLSSLAPPIFSLFFTQETIGYYAYALMFYTASLLLPSSISFIILPQTSELNAMKRNKRASTLLKKAFLYYTPVVIFGSLLVLLLSKFVVGLISPNYLPSLPILKTLIIFGLFSGYGLIYSAYLVGKGNIKRTAVVMIVINILLYMISGFILSNF